MILGDRYDFKDASEGIDKTVAGAEYVPKDLEMPEEFPELERPPLRKIDKYCTPECPCCNLSKRYTQVQQPSPRCSNLHPGTASNLYPTQVQQPTPRDSNLHPGTASNLHPGTATCT